MTIEQLISPSVPTLIPTDTGDKALLMMDENSMNQLPLVSEDKYMALVHENDLLDWDKTTATLDIADFLTYRPAVLANGHPYDALRLAHQQNLSVVPVIDNDNTYLGAITTIELLKYITEKSGLDNPGGIIVLEMEPRNYSLYEIARICESEEVLLISTQIFSNRITGKLEVTLKTNRTHLGAVVASLERYNYKVKEVFGDKTDNENMTDRFNLLMNYINM
ncbi:MAG: CBS domain-containing protein [Bacteroidetes bacterium]|nr:CBS domain-containing protein [Bacteroidota bacterium]